MFQQIVQGEIGEDVLNCNLIPLEKCSFKNGDDVLQFDLLRGLLDHLLQIFQKVDEYDVAHTSQPQQRPHYEDSLWHLHLSLVDEGRTHKRGFPLEAEIVDGWVEGVNFSAFNSVLQHC